MTQVDAALALIRKTLAEIGTAEFARISGVPYTTLNDCKARDFEGPNIETLKKLSAAAEQRARSAKSGKAAA